MATDSAWARSAAGRTALIFFSIVGALALAVGIVALTSHTWLAVSQLLIAAAAFAVVVSIARARRSG